MFNLYLNDIIILEYLLFFQNYINSRHSVHKVIKSTKRMLWKKEVKRRFKDKSDWSDSISKENLVKTIKGSHSHIKAYIHLIWKEENNKMIEAQY